MDMYEITLKSSRVNRIKEKINKVNFCLMEKCLKKDLKIAMQKTIKAHPYELLPIPQRKFGKQ